MVYEAEFRVFGQFDWLFGYVDYGSYPKIQ